MTPLLASYRPLSAFSDPAQPTSQLWRTLLGLVAVMLVYILWLAGLNLFLQWRYGRILAAAIREGMFQGQTAGMALLGLFSFAGLLIGTLAVVRLIHRRRAGTLFGPPARMIRDFRVAAGGVLTLNLVFLIFSIGDDSLRPGQSLGPFLVHLPFALICLLIQTGAEEVIFRGYLIQQLAARFRTPAVWMLIPALLFAMGHYAPDLSGNAAPYVVTWAILFGILAADLTARTGTLGAAWGFHFANNAMVMLLVNSEGSFSGLALWLAPTPAMDAGGGSLLAALLVQCASLCCSWLAARIALRR